jgi:hypothetical protein
MSTQITPFKQLENALGIQPQEHYNVLKVEENLPASIEDARVEQNIDYVEVELKDTIRQLDDSIEKVQAIGELSEAPGAYRVIGELASTKIAALKELRELRKKQPSTAVTVGTVNNTQVNAGAFNINDILRELRNN